MSCAMRCSAATAVTLGSLVSFALLLGACRPTYPACRGDDDCLGSEFCVAGQCQQCRQDGDCPDGQRCAAGRCEPRTDRCVTDGECVAGTRCRGGRCVETEEPGDASGRAAGECRLEPVYFGFDEAALDERGRATTEANARCIERKGLRGLTLVGHADARGTEEYNLALGERRARAALELLGSFGVEGAVDAVQTMGEELAVGEDDAGFAADRRVDFELGAAGAPGEDR